MDPRIWTETMLRRFRRWAGDYSLCRDMALLLRHLRMYYALWKASRRDTDRDSVNACVALVTHLRGRCPLGYVGA